jgi:hypothetical protein
MDSLCSQILGHRKFLDQKIGGIFAGKDTKVEYSTKPAVLLTTKVGICSDTHDRTEAEGALVQRLAEIGLQNDQQAGYNLSMHIGSYPEHAK